MTELILSIAAAVAGLWAASLEWRLRNMSSKLDEKPSRSESAELIDLKLEGQKVLQQELKEDMSEVKSKIDRIYDVLVKNKN